MGEKRNVYDKMVDFFDVHFGFEKTPLKPIPVFALNPTYWLGLLLALTFIMQGVTGAFQLLYYVPSSTNTTLGLNAYTSTTNVIDNVPLGSFIETMHLYTAYAMVLLTFLHLMRNYFGSTHKERRELMWVAGIVLMLIIFSFATTGYSLPWTVISKSATDVAIGFLNVVPGQLGVFVRFLLTGTGEPDDLLRRFTIIHTVVLPGLLALFLGLKIYMYEVHGPSFTPAFSRLKANAQKYLHWFPQIFLYGTMIMSAYIAILVAASSLFPISLPPEYSAQAASQYAVQPDWYLLWVYQILKFQIFAGTGEPFALGLVGVFFLLLMLLPFYDRSSRRGISSRPFFITIGAILVTEFVALTIWGYLTPGQVIPTLQAVAVMGGVAVATIAIMQIIYGQRKESKSNATNNAASEPLDKREPISPSGNLRAEAFGLGRNSKLTISFVLLLIVAASGLAYAINSLSSVGEMFPGFLLSVSAFACSMALMTWIVKRVVVSYESQGGTNA